MTTHPFATGLGAVVEVRAFDDAGTEYGPLTLAIGAGKVRHFNSHDLETGNAAKGLTGPPLDFAAKLSTR